MMMRITLTRSWILSFVLLITVEVVMKACEVRELSTSVAPKFAMIVFLAHSLVSLLRLGTIDERAACRTLCWTVFAFGFGLSGTPHFYSKSSPQRYCQIMTWVGESLVVSSLVVLVAIALFWKSKDTRLSNSKYCNKCNYNLTGNVSGICPECGCATKLGKGGVHDGSVS